MPEAFVWLGFVLARVSGRHVADTDRVSSDGVSWVVLGGGDRDWERARERGRVM